MYWRHFNLTAEPFSLTPDPSFLYLSPVHAEAYAALMMGLRERRGLTTMIGEVGTGKTTLVYSVLSGLGPEIHTAYVSNARLSFDGILRVALRDFGVPCDSAHSSELTDAFNAFLLDCANKGTTAALVIDEAQNLSFETFEDLRLLTNFETYTHKLLQIVLVGQPELDTKLRDPALRQVSERVAVRCVVNPLTRRESRAYLEHRLAAVNGSVDIFTGAALRLLIARSRGIPRSLNILAHNSMLFAYGEAAPRVTRRFVAAAVREKEGRGLVRLWRRPQRAAAKRGWRSSFWTMSAAAACGVVVGLAIAGGETLFGKLSTPTTRAATSITPQEPVLSVETPDPIAPPSEPEPSAVELPAEEPALPETAPLLEAAEEVPQEIPVAVDAPVAAEPPSQAALVPEPSAAAPAPVVAPPAEVAVAPSASPPAATVETAPVIEPTPPAESAQPEPAPTALASAPQPQPQPQPESAVRPTPAPPAPPRPTARAPAPRPAPRSQTVASAPAPRPAPAVTTTTSADPSRDNTAAEDRARVIRVPPGSSLSGLLLTVYGQYSSEMLDRVKAENPQVNDPDFIIAGDELRFPDASQGQSTQPAGGQTR